MPQRCSSELPFPEKFWVILKKSYHVGLNISSYLCSVGFTLVSVNVTKEIYNFLRGIMGFP